MVLLVLVTGYWRRARVCFTALLVCVTGIKLVTLGSAGGVEIISPGAELHFHKDGGGLRHYE